MKTNLITRSAMVRFPATGWPSWRFTLLLGLGYTLVFHLWTSLARREAVILTGLTATVWLGHELAKAARAGYFVNRWDLVFHAVVILDVLLEGLLIPIHSGLGFYWCTLAFGVVVAGYRQFGLRRHPLTPGFKTE